MRDSIKARNNQISINADLAYEIHMKDRGLSWQEMSIPQLFTRLIQELGEFMQDPDYKEAGDVMNFMSMIIAHRKEGINLGKGN